MMDKKQIDRGEERASSNNHRIIVSAIIDRQIDRIIVSAIASTMKVKDVLEICRQTLGGTKNIFFNLQAVSLKVPDRARNPTTLI